MTNYTFVDCFIITMTRLSSWVMNKSDYALYSSFKVLEIINLINMLIDITIMNRSFRVKVVLINNRRRQ